MEQMIFKIVYGIGWAFIVIIRIPYQWQARTNRIVVDRKTAREISLLALEVVGAGLLPLVYIFTSWMNFANYRLPIWAGWIGAACFAIALWLFWRAHADLGQNWSRSFEIRQEHQLVTSGIYRHIRHRCTRAVGYLASPKPCCCGIG